jgi:hypothetical protein
MTRRLDGQKRRQWEERFERFHASGLTVGRFCANERVSVNTFYYWSKRMGRRSTTARSAERKAASGGSRDSELRRRVLVAATNSPLVHFRLHTGVDVSVPANCLTRLRELGILENVAVSSKLNIVLGDKGLRGSAASLSQRHRDMQPEQRRHRAGVRTARCRNEIWRRD